MTAPENASVPWYGTSSDWATILAGAGMGAGSAMQGAAQYVTSKQEAQEAKRRTIANLMNSAMKRNRKLLQQGQEYSDEINDYKSQALHQVARGFVESLQGIGN